MKLKEVIIKKYCLRVNKIEINDESTDGNVYIVHSNDNKYVLKVYDSFEHAISMVDIHNYLSNNDISVPKILKNSDDKFITNFDKKYLVLYSFLPGVQLRDYVSDNDIYKNIAKSVKRMHDVTSGFNKFGLDSIPFLVDDDFDNFSLIHFDLTNCNIFYDTSFYNYIGFIDFDDAKYGPCIIDVAIIISLLFFSKTRGVNKEGLNIFLREYYNPLELDKNLPFVKKYALRWIDYVIDNNNFDSSTQDSFIIRRNLIDEFFEE